MVFSDPVRRRKVKFRCEYCEYRNESQTYLTFGHIRRAHPDRWTQIQAEIEAENKRGKIEAGAQLEDEQSIKCPRCGGGGKLFINQKGQERIPGEDYHA